MVRVEGAAGTVPLLALYLSTTYTRTTGSEPSPRIRPNSRTLDSTPARNSFRLFLIMENSALAICGVGIALASYLSNRFDSRRSRDAQELESLRNRVSQLMRDIAALEQRHEDEQESWQAERLSYLHAFIQEERRAA